MEQPRFNLPSRESIIDKWRESGLLRGLDRYSVGDTISYFENRIDGARKIEHKIRPMQQLITVMMLNIIKKHCS